MTLTLDVADNNINLGEVRALVSTALEKELLQAQARRDTYLAQCNRFEQEHGMTSNHFLVAFEAGELGDDEYLFDWFAAKQGLDRWQHRVKVLSGVTVAGA